MNNFVDSVSDVIQVLNPFINVLESLSAFTVVGAFSRWVWYNFHYVRIDLSVGSFKVRRKDKTWQKLTPIVSNTFYGGGNVLDSVRKEILQITSIKVKDVVRKTSDEEPKLAEQVCENSASQEA